MVKVITEVHVKKGEEEKYIALIKEFHPLAKQQPGYIKAEPLVDSENGSIFLVVATWENPEYWKAWINSNEGRKFSGLLTPLLLEKPKRTIYNLISLY